MLYRLFILCTILLTACVAPSSYFPSAEEQAVKQEASTHEDLVRNKKARESSLTEAEAKDKLNRVAPKILVGGKKLCQDLQKGPCDYKVELSKNKGINAFADGKRIVVTKDMIAFAQNDTELAVVVGHEFAHNMMRHIRAQTTNSVLGSLAGLALDSVLASQGVNSGSNFSRLGSHIGTMRYSQDFEREADYVGLYVTARSGYDIQNAPNLWRRMSLENEKAIYTATSHPTNPERYVALEKTVAEIARKQRNNIALIPNLKAAN